MAQWVNREVVHYAVAEHVACQRACGAAAPLLSAQKLFVETHRRITRGSRKFAGP